MSVSLSRFQLIEGNPPNLPQKCTICGSINGTFIDFQLDLEFYGTVYFCVENCFTQLANELGYRSPAQHHVTLEALRIRMVEINDLQDQNEELKNAVAALRRIDGGDNGTDGSPVHPLELTEEAVRKHDEDERESSKQDTKPRPTDLLDDDGFSKLLDDPS